MGEATELADAVRGHFLDGEPDGGERGGEERGGGIVAAREDAELLGNPASAGVGGREHPGGGAVAEAENRGGLGLAREQAIERGGTGGGCEVAVDDVLRFDAEAETLAGETHTAVEFIDRGIGGTERAGDDGEPLVAKPVQVLDGELRGARGIMNCYLNPAFYIIF